MSDYFRAILSLSMNQMKRFMRDKVALFFTFVFPLIFLFVFGGIFGSEDQVTFSTAVINNSDTEFAAQFEDQLAENELFELTEFESVEEAQEPLGRGEYDVILEIPESFGAIDEQGRPVGELQTYYDEADQQLFQTFNAVMSSILDGINAEFVDVSHPLTLNSQPIQTSNLSSFDYTFSGLIAFSILSLAIFGLSNGLPADKKAGYLRRLRSTPLHVSQLILAIALQYLIIGLLSVATMIVVGIAVFDFNMRGDWFNFTIFTMISILMMFGFGLAIGGWAKNEQQAAPLSNLVAFPLMFLSGVFFPVFLMPEWLQTVAVALPLTPIVDGLRLILTEGKTILDLSSELLLISAWGLGIYIVAIRFFRWD